MQTLLPLPGSEGRAGKAGTGLWGLSLSASRKLGPLGRTTLVLVLHHGFLGWGHISSRKFPTRDPGPRASEQLCPGSSMPTKSRR